MKPVIIIGIIIGMVIAAVGIFATIPADTWKDKRTEFTGVAPPDENYEKIDCFSKNGNWDGTSCNLEELFEEPFEESFDISSAPSSTQKCSGAARCLVGVVTKIVDGDTIHVDGESVRFALSSAPELKGYGGIDSRNFIETICPVGSVVLVDEDDGQIIGSYGRMVGMVICNEVNLNSELLDANLGNLELRFCDSSEFGDTDWAKKHGC